MEVWFTELQTRNTAYKVRVIRTLHYEKSRFQEILVIDTYEYGRLLALDGAIQTTVADEFIYHEMIAHVPLFTHPDAKRVLVVGGGDGGTVREVLKHPSVERVVLCEIDERVIEVSKRYLPEISARLDDPKVTIVCEDGIEYVGGRENEFDVIIIDSSDPIGPAVGLFSSEFYASVHRALKPDGLFVAQTESPFFNRDFIRKVFSSVKDIFPIARLYVAPVPTYPGGFWSFTLGSKTYDPIAVEDESIGDFHGRYYTKDVHKAAFMLPQHVLELIK